MIEFLEQDFIHHGKGAVFFLELLILLMVGRFAKSKLAGYHLDDELTKEDNPAVAISFAGYIMGMLIALVGVFVGDGVQETQNVLGMDIEPFIYNLISVAVWGLFAIVALNLSRIITDRVILRSFGNIEELVRDRNIGVGVCEAAGYVSSGLIIRSAIAGEGYWWLAPVYLALGLLLLVLGALVLKSLVFRSYNLEKEIENDNHAAGVLFGLHILAVGYLINQVIDRTAPHNLSEISGVNFFSAFGIELALASVFLLIGLAALFLLSLVTDRLMLPKSNLQEEILKDQNLGVAIISGVVAFGGSILVTTIF